MIDDKRKATIRQMVRVYRIHTEVVKTLDKQTQSLRKYLNEKGISDEEEITFAQEYEDEIVNQD